MYVSRNVFPLILNLTISKPLGESRLEKQESKRTGYVKHNAADLFLQFVTKGYFHENRDKIKIRRKFVEFHDHLKLEIV